MWTGLSVCRQSDRSEICARTHGLITALNRLADTLGPKEITRITRAALVLLQVEHGRIS